MEKRNLQEKANKMLNKEIRSGYMNVVKKLMKEEGINQPDAQHYVDVAIDNMMRISEDDIDRICV